jgi:heat shock protein HslJ
MLTVLQARRRGTRAALVAIAAVFALVACGESGGNVTDTAWTLASYGDEGNGTAVINGTTVTLAFDAEGKATGSAGCNSYFGGYTAADGEFEIGPLGSTMMNCEEPIMQQEFAFLRVLEAATTYAVDGDRLEIAAPDGQVLSLDRAE